MSRKTRTRIYISCPLSLGDLEHNINQALRCFWRLNTAGYAPFNPALSCFSQEVRRDETAADGKLVCEADVACGMSWERWLDYDLCWVEASHALLRLPGESRGADKEVDHAQEIGIPVYFDEAELRRIVSPTRIYRRAA